MKIGFVTLGWLFLFALSTQASAIDCIDHEENQYGSSFLVNTCNKKIGPINFCWESMESSCSCYQGGGCGAGTISPGKREVISGSGRKQYTRIKFSYCVYDDWVNGTCRPEKYR